jgi:predicted nucleic acid-binding protein
MPEFVIADTSVLIIFEKLNHLQLLKDIYRKIYITPEIREEYGYPLPDWIEITSLIDKKHQDLLCAHIDLGEASAIALAMVRDNSLLLVDDIKARKLAKSLNLRFTGTLGVIDKAKNLGIISEIKTLIVRLQETNFRIADNIITELLRRNGE